MIRRGPVDDADDRRLCAIREIGGGGIVGEVDDDDFPVAVRRALPGRRTKQRAAGQRKAEQQEKEDSATVNQNAALTTAMIGSFESQIRFSRPNCTPCIRSQALNRPSWKPVTS